MRQPVAAVAVAIAAVLATACEKVPLLAPTGSSITLTTPTTALSANGSTTIVAQVLESSGTPPHSGTRVLFMTTLGTIEPSEISTDASGRASVTFRANGASGIAEISASSGGATTSGSATSTSTTTTTQTTPSGSSNRNLTIYVGTAAVGRVLVVASPAVLPTAGGTTTITANVLDRNGNALAAAPVTFSTTAGTMSASVVNTDGSGNAVATLTTFQAATVTATVGLGTSGTGTGGTTGGTGGTTTSTNQASVTISLTSAPTLAITPPTTPPSAGLPSSFTFKVTPASSGSTTGTGGTTTSTGTIPIRELVIDWGDGARDNLGAVSGDQIVAHTFRSAGSYSVSATVTDVAGGTARVATVVSVIAVPRPTIIVTPTPQSAPGGSTITFRIEITAPAGLAINNVVIDFGDGTSQSLGGASGVLQVPHAYAAGVRTLSVTVTVTDSSGQSTVGSAIVSITT